MRRDLVTSAIAIVALTVLFGVAYPLLVTGAGQALFPDRAGGSFVERGGRAVGSRLIAQDFKHDPRYFQPRPSPTTSYNPSATAFGNLGPNSEAGRRVFATNLAAYLGLERRYTPGLTAAAVPVDAVTDSASGVDPHISRANAGIQAHRVAAVRRLPLARVDSLIASNTDDRSLGILGEPGVNVLELNLALDRGVTG